MNKKALLIFAVVVLFLTMALCVALLREHNQHLQRNPAMAPPPEQPISSEKLVSSPLWLNPDIEKTWKEQITPLKNRLQMCAGVPLNLPVNCRAGSKRVTEIAEGDDVRWSCNWKCETHPTALYRVTAGPWSLSGVDVRVLNRHCGPEAQKIFDDPGQYEAMFCEAECMQMHAIVAVSKVDIDCAMNYFSILSVRPICVGPISNSCRHDLYPPSDQRNKRNGPDKERRQGFATWKYEVCTANVVE